MFDIYINNKSVHPNKFLNIAKFIVSTWNDRKIISILNIEPPDFPRNLHVIEKGSRHINLGWTTSQDGNSPITQYIIEYKTESGKCIHIRVFVIDLAKRIKYKIF